MAPQVIGRTRGIDLGSVMSLIFAARIACNAKLGDKSPVNLISITSSLKKPIPKLESNIRTLCTRATGAI